MGIVDTLLPYVHPGCSPSAELISTDFLQQFLRGNQSSTTDGLHRSSGICVKPRVLPALSGARLSGVYLLVLSRRCLLPSAAVPEAGSGSVGFPHSANFLLTFFCRTCPLQHLGGFLFLFSIFLMPQFFFLPPAVTLCAPLASLACVLHVCPHVYVC